MFNNRYWLPARRNANRIIIITVISIYDYIALVIILINPLYWLAKQFRFLSPVHIIISVIAVAIETNAIVQNIHITTGWEIINFYVKDIYTADITLHKLFYFVSSAERRSLGQYYFYDLYVYSNLNKLLLYLWSAKDSTRKNT